MRSEQPTPRELEILQLYASGLDSPDIAKYLDINPATLRTHRQNILTRLKVHSITQAISKGIKEGWVVVESYEAEHRIWFAGLDNRERTEHLGVHGVSDVRLQASGLGWSVAFLIGIHFMAHNEEENS